MTKAKKKINAHRCAANESANLCVCVCLVRVCFTNVVVQVFSDVCNFSTSHGLMTTDIEESTQFSEKKRSDGLGCK